MGNDDGDSAAQPEDKGVRRRLVRDGEQGQDGDLDDAENKDVKEEAEEAKDREKVEGTEVKKENPKSKPLPPDVRLRISSSSFRIFWRNRRTLTS